MIIAKHIAILQVLLPFFATLFSALSFNRRISWLIATIAIASSLLLAIYAAPVSKSGILYSLGNWQGAIGIEYRLDRLSQPIIIYLNAALLFMLIFGRQFINSNIISHIKDKQQHLFYSLLLFAHVGYLGIISTNDLFNIYVFIEISSLAAYVLMSMGNNSKALIGAFDYLMLGTIGATLMLIGIGFFLALTGSLNITDVATILKEQESSNILIVAIVFFLSGSILKMAFFPMHFWMMRAYYASSPIILTYLAAISSFLGIYILMRFIHFTIDIELIWQSLISVLRPMAMATIAICTFLALRSDNLKKVIIYSTASQIGYIFLLLTIMEARELMFQLLILDGINKIALFTLIAHLQSKSADFMFKTFKAIEGKTLFKILCAFIIVFSAGLPLTGMFIVKVKIFDLLISNNLMLEFIVVILGAVLAILYHIKIAKAIFMTSAKHGTIHIDSKLHGLVAIVLMQIISLIYINDLSIVV